MSQQGSASNAGSRGSSRSLTIDAVGRPGDVVGSPFARSSIGRICTLVRGVCTDAAVARRDVEDLLIAVSEIAVNAIGHGGDAGAITVRQTDRGVAVEISDAGTPESYSLGDVAHNGADEPHGLRLARLMCSEFSITSGPCGVIVRMFASSAVTAGSAGTR